MQPSLVLAVRLALSGRAACQVMLACTGGSASLNKVMSRSPKRRIRCRPTMSQGVSHAGDRCTEQKNRGSVESAYPVFPCDIRHHVRSGRDLHPAPSLGRGDIRSDQRRASILLSGQMGTRAIGACSDRIFRRYPWDQTLSCAASALALFAVPGGFHIAWHSCRLCNRVIVEGWSGSCDGARRRDWRTGRDPVHDAVSWLHRRVRMAWHGSAFAATPRSACLARGSGWRDLGCLVFTGIFPVRH